MKTDEEIFNASEEELEAMEAEAETGDTGEESTDEQVQNPEHPEDQAQDEETDEEESGEQETGSEESQEKTDDTDEAAATQKRVKDMHAEITRQQQANAELRRRIQEMEKQAELNKSSNFKELSPEELEDLKYDDPDKYAEYLISKREHEANKASIEGELSHLRKNEAVNELRNNLTAFAQKRLKVANADELKKQLGDTESETRKTVEALNEFMNENLNPVKVVDGFPVYSEQQFDIAYRALYNDKLESQVRTQAREEALAEIQRAANGGSHFDRMGANGNGGARSKKIEDYTAEEIYNMSESELDQIEKQFELGD